MPRKPDDENVVFIILELYDNGRVGIHDQMTSRSDAEATVLRKRRETGREFWIDEHHLEAV